MGLGKNLQLSLHRQASARLAYFVNELQARALFQTLIPLKIHWSCQVSVDIAHNQKLLALMEKSGCTSALVGFESLNEQNLAQMKKKWNLKHGNYATAVQRFRDRGSMIYGTFVFGYDEDTLDSFEISEELTEACWHCRSTYNSLSSLIRRAFALKTNMRSLYKLGVYLRYSPIFRREVFKKHSMRFGLH